MWQNTKLIWKLPALHNLTKSHFFVNARVNFKLFLRWRPKNGVIWHQVWRHTHPFSIETFTCEGFYQMKYFNHHLLPTAQTLQTQRTQDHRCCWYSPLQSPSFDITRSHCLTVCFRSLVALGESITNPEKSCCRNFRLWEPCFLILVLKVTSKYSRIFYNQMYFITEK